MTMEPPSAPGQPPLNADEVSQLLQHFVEAGNRPVEATVDDLVRVRVGGGLNLLTVEILDPALDPAMKRRLETAIVGAVNTALQRAALAAGQALSDLAQRSRTGNASA